jgi:hypothetical protein
MFGENRRKLLEFGRICSYYRGRNIVLRGTKKKAKAAATQFPDSRQRQSQNFPGPGFT